MKYSLYNQKGSVDDIRCTLSLINPVTSQQLINEVELLTESIEDEMQNQNRATVLKMLASKKSRIERLIKTKLTD